MCLLFPSGCRRENPDGGRPKFATTSQEPILLRCRLVEGQTLSLAVEMEMTVRVSVGDEKMEMPALAEFGLTLTVHSVDDDGVADVTTVVPSLEVTTTPPDGPEITYNSEVDAKPDDASLAVFAALVGVPVKGKVNSLGEWLELDTEPMLAALREAGPPAVTADALEQMMEQFPGNALMRLPGGPIKPGEVYDAGQLDIATPGLGTMRTDIRYKLLEVSGDGKRAVLEPIMTSTFEPDAGSPAQMTIEDKGGSGWVLIDVATGQLLESKVSTSVLMRMSLGGEEMEMEFEVEFRARQLSDDDDARE